MRTFPGSGLDSSFQVAANPARPSSAYPMREGLE